MKQTTKIIQSNFDFTQDLDFVFEATGLAILVEDTQQNIILTNTLFCNLFDLNTKQNKLINTSSLALFQQIKNCFKDPEKFEQQVAALTEKNSIVTNQSFALINGKNIKQNYYPLFKNDTHKGHIWVYESLQKAASSVLANSSFKIENALHFLPNEIAIYNTDSQIIFINKAYINNSEKRNWAKENTLQQYFSYENLPIEIATTREHYFKQAIQTKSAVSWQETNHPSYLTFLRTCYPITDEFKKVTAILEFSNDITQQKKLELKLQQAVDYFYNTLNNVSNIVLQTDEKLQLQFLNNYWQNITGQNTQALTGKSVFEILEITHYELYQKVFSILNNNSKKETGEIAIEDKDKNTTLRTDKKRKRT
ncbi:MAG: PAS domain-containing protein [Bacteroidetes bacterium]|nr:PAS domain-containing protein [Bacteroidota bacterium]